MWYKIKKVRIWVNNEEKQIYPAGWKPWSNTLLYWPLTTDASDQSWNNNDGTWYSVSSYSGSNWAYFDGSSFQQRIEFPHSLDPWTQFTLNCWFKTWNNNETFIFSNWWFSYRRLIFSISWWNISLWVWNGGSWQSFIDNVTWAISNNTWYNLWFVRNNYDYSVYVNGVLWSSWTVSYNPSWSWNINWYSINKGSWTSWSWTSAISYFKDYIIETSMWTSDDFLNYYNSTKSNYGL